MEFLDGKIFRIFKKKIYDLSFHFSNLEQRLEELVLKDDGNLVLYGLNHEIIWQTYLKQNICYGQQNFFFDRIENIDLVD